MAYCHCFLYNGNNIDRIGVLQCAVKKLEFDKRMEMEGVKTPKYTALEL